jgi:hypothetical protein
MPFSAIIACTFKEEMLDWRDTIVPEEERMMRVSGRIWSCEGEEEWIRVP